MFHKSVVVYCLDGISCTMDVLIPLILPFCISAGVYDLAGSSFFLFYLFILNNLRVLLFRS